MAVFCLRGAEGVRPRNEVLTCVCVFVGKGNATESESCTERSDIRHLRGRVTMCSIEGTTAGICFGFIERGRCFAKRCLRVATGLAGFCMRTW